MRRLCTIESTHASYTRTRARKYETHKAHRISIENCRLDFNRIMAEKKNVTKTLSYRDRPMPLTSATIDCCHTPPPNARAARRFLRCRSHVVEWKQQQRRRHHFRLYRCTKCFVTTAYTTYSNLFEKILPRHPYMALAMVCNGFGFCLGFCLVSISCI